MAEIPKLDRMGSEKLIGASKFEEISVSDHVKGFQCTPTKSDSFVLDMERFSHLIENDMNSNSRVTLQRNLSRKGSLRGGEKKTIANTANERDISFVATSPRAATHAGGTPERPLIGAVGAGNNYVNQPVHNQITIVNGSIGNTAVENKFIGKRLSFRRNSSPWTIDPRRILLFFATMSSIGTILLIYFTLHISKHNEDYKADPH